MVVLHSVPPLVVFVAVEAITDLRDKLSKAALAASMNTAEPLNETSDQATELTERLSRDEIPETKKRTTFDEYLSRAREAWQPGITVTPAWIRQVTACSRGLSSRLAAALTDEVSESEEHHDRHP